MPEFGYSYPGIAVQSVSCISRPPKKESRAGEGKGEGRLVAGGRWQLFQECGEDGEDEAGEVGDVVPLDASALEEEDNDEGERGEGDQHLQQPPLDRPGHHLGIVGADMGLPYDSVELFRKGGDM